MLKKILLILLTIVVGIVLLVAPSAIRWFYYYEGSYQPGKVSRPDLTQIEEPLAEPQPFADHQVTAGSGTILVDLAHANRVQMAELSVLQARLAARGHRLEPITDADDLAGQLRHAQALVIVSPAEDWSADEIQQAAAKHVHIDDLINMKSRETIARMGTVPNEEFEKRFTAIEKEMKQEVQSLIQKVK